MAVGGVAVEQESHDEREAKQRAGRRRMGGHWRGTVGNTSRRGMNRPMWGIAGNAANTGRLAAASRRRINNPPQINNLPHKRLMPTTHKHHGPHCGILVTL